MKRTFLLIVLSIAQTTHGIFPLQSITDKKEEIKLTPAQKYGLISLGVVGIVGTIVGGYKLVKRDRYLRANAADKDGALPLSYCINGVMTQRANGRPLNQYGALDDLKKVLADGACVNVIDPYYGLSHLMRSVSMPEVVRILLAHGANVNLQNSRGETALLWAIGSNLETVGLLVDKGADPNLAHAMREAVEKDIPAAHYIIEHSRVAINYDDLNLRHQIFWTCDKRLIEKSLPLQCTQQYLEEIFRIVAYREAQFKDTAKYISYLDTRVWLRNKIDALKGSANK